MMSIPNVGQPMLKLVSAALVLLWACCVFFRGLLGEMGLGEGTQRPNRTPSSAPKGLEYRRVRRFGRRLVAVRLQVILC